MYIKIVEKSVLFGDETKDRSIPWWDFITFENFWWNANGKKKTQRKVVWRLSLTVSMIPKSSSCIRNYWYCNRSLWSFIEWYKTLFQQTEAHENAILFGWKLIAAAESRNTPNTIVPKATGSFPCIAIYNQLEGTDGNTLFGTHCFQFKNASILSTSLFQSIQSKELFPISKQLNSSINRWNQWSTRASCMPFPGIQRSCSCFINVCFACK